MSQYLGIGFLFTALVAISRDRGGSLEDIGVIFVLGMVWAVKFLWAPLVDRFGSRRLGHYRSWLLVTQPAAALAVAAIAPFDVIDNLGIILGLLAVVAILSATQDIATDALAVRTVRGRGRGPLNGLQVGAGFIGDVVGGGAVLVVYDLFGWVPAILTLAVVTAVPLLAIARFREPRAEPAVITARVRRRAIRSLFAQPGVPRWALVIMPLLVLGAPGASGLLVPILVDDGISVGVVGVLTNVVGGLVSIVSAIVAGQLIPVLGKKRALVIYSAGTVIGIASMIPVAATGGMVWAIVAIAVLNVFNSASYVALYTINMDYSRPANAGSDFTIQVSISYFARFVVTGVIVGLAGSIGYVSGLVVCIGLALIGVLAAATLYRESAEVRPVTEEPGALDQAA